MCSTEPQLQTLLHNCALILLLSKAHFTPTSHLWIFLNYYSAFSFLLFTLEELRAVRQIVVYILYCPGWNNRKYNTQIGEIFATCPRQGVSKIRAASLRYARIFCHIFYESLFSDSYCLGQAGRWKFPLSAAGQRGRMPYSYTQPSVETGSTAVLGEATTAS